MRISGFRTHNIGALIIRIGLGGHFSIIITRNSQNSESHVHSLGCGRVHQEPAVQEGVGGSNGYQTEQPLLSEIYVGVSVGFCKSCITAS